MQGRGGGSELQSPRRGQVTVALHVGTYVCTLYSVHIYSVCFEERGWRGRLRSVLKEVADEDTNGVGMYVRSME